MTERASPRLSSCARHRARHVPMTSPAAGYARPSSGRRRPSRFASEGDAAARAERISPRDRADDVACLVRDQPGARSCTTASSPTRVLGLAIDGPSPARRLRAERPGRYAGHVRSAPRRVAGRAAEKSPARRGAEPTRFAFSRVACLQPRIRIAPRTRSSGVPLGTTALDEDAGEEARPKGSGRCSCAATRRAPGAPSERARRPSGPRASLRRCKKSASRPPSSVRLLSHLTIPRTASGHGGTHRAPSCRRAEERELAEVSCRPSPPTVFFDGRVE